MKLANRTRLSLDRLEDRWTPAFDAFVTGAGDLIVNVTQDDEFLSIEDTVNPGEFVISDAGQTETVSGVLNNIRVNLNFEDNFVEIRHLNDDLPGNVFVNGGAGFNELFIEGDGNNIRGSITGNRINSFELIDVTVQGNVFVTAQGDPNMIGNLFDIDFDSRVEGNVIFTGGTLQDSIIINGRVDGSAIIRGVAGTNDLSVESDAFIGGNLIYTGGNGNDTITTLDGIVAKDVLLKLGNGSNVVGEFAGEIGRNLTILGGNGQDDIGAVPGTFDGTIGGNLTLLLGNGPNTFNFDGLLFGSRLTYIGGASTDTVTIDANATAPGAFLYVLLQAGDDDLTIDANSFFARGFVDGGFGTDTIDNNAQFPIIVRNF